MAVDFEYLERFAAGDRAVVAEVLSLFREQAAGWTPRLSAKAADWREVAHTIKGTARGVGAFALGDACAKAEEVGARALPTVLSELAAALREIEAYQARA